MKILHISGAKSWGGNEQQLLNTLVELNKQDTVNYIFGMRDSILEQRCKEIGLHFIDSQLKKISDFKNVSFLQRLLKKHNFDVVHLHTSDALTLFAYFSFLHKTTAKVFFSKKGIGASSSFLSRIKYNLSSICKIICVSSLVKKDFEKMIQPKNRHKLLVLPDNVNSAIIHQTKPFLLKEKYQIAADEFLIGSIANHTKAKDLFTMVDVVRELIVNRAKTHIRCIQIGGFTKLTPEIRAYAEKKGVSDAIIFTDSIANASVFCDEMNVFLVTSEREGGPSSALEAMLFKVPVVSTQVGLMDEIIQSGENGYLAPVKGVQQLADGVEYFMENKEAGHSFGEKNYEMIIQEFNSEKITEELIKIYKSLC